MRLINRSALFAVLALPAMFAEEWELGALGGYAMTRSVKITNSAGSVSAGFKSSPFFGFVAGANERRYLGGEASYVYRSSDIKVDGNGREVTFPAYIHFVDFRLVIHFTPEGSRLRPFVAAGGGVAIYTGTGTESSSQPLNNIVALTATRDIKPMFSPAVGVKFRLSRHVGLRFEFRDYMSSFPDQVIAPAPGSSSPGWLHNYTPMGGITAVW